MSGATFDCPHCGASYPRKPVLVNKVVRCTACKQAFRLREDGIAEKVAQASPPPVPARPPTGRFSQGTEAPKTTEEGRGPARALTRQQLEARKAMASSLSEAMGAALKQEADKQTDQAAQESQRKTARASGEDGKVRLGPAVLSNQGEQEARLGRRWLIGTFSALTILVAAWLFLTWKGPREAALDAFLAPVTRQALQSEGRLRAIQSRAWLDGDASGVTVAPFIDLPSPRFGKIIRLNSQSLSPCAKLQGLMWIPDLRVWSDHPEEARRLAAKAESEKKEGSAKIISEQALQAELAAAGMDPDTVPVVLAFLRSPAAKGAFPVGERLREGKLPTGLEWCDFSGRGGDLLVPGQGVGGFRPVPRDFQGRLLRFLGGDGWPTGWRIFSLQPTAR